MGESSNILAASSILQGGTTLASAYGQSQAIKTQGEYQAKIEEINAKRAGFQAEDAIKRGDKDSQNVKAQAKKLIAEQRTASAAQGIDVAYGSALDVQLDTAGLAELDALTIKNNAWREAYGYKSQALDYSSRGEFTSLASRNIAKNTLLTGGLSAAAYGLQGYGYYAQGKKLKGAT